MFLSLFLDLYAGYVNFKWTVPSHMSCGEHKVKIRVTGEAEAQVDDSSTHFLCSCLVRTVHVNEHFARIIISVINFSAFDS